MRHGFVDKKASFTEVFIELVIKKFRIIIVVNKLKSSLCLF